MNRINKITKTAIIILWAVVAIGFIIPGVAEWTQFASVAMATIMLVVERWRR